MAEPTDAKPLPLERRRDNYRERMAKAEAVRNLMRIQPWAPGIQPDWTVQEIRNTLRQHEQGSMWRSALLVDAIGRDDRIPSILRHRVRGLLSFPFSMVPFDSTDMAKEFASEWEDGWDAFAPSATLAAMMADYVMLGVAIGQIAWDRKTEGGLMPRLYREHPSFLRYDETLNQYFYQTRAGEEVVTPGDGRWVLFEAGERGYMNGAVRALALLWLIRQFAWRDWARYSERHGMPLLLAKHPAEIRDDERDEFWSDIIALGSETVALLPQGVGPDGEGFDLELLEASDRNWKAFDELKKSASTSIAIYLLGQNLTTEVDAGSFAAASVHKNIRSEIITADANELTTDLFDQAVVPISRLLRPNGGQLAPRPHYDTTPPADKKLAAETAKTVAETLSILDGIGISIEDVAAFGREHDLSLVQDTAPTQSASTDVEKQNGADQAFREGQGYVDALTRQQTHEAGKVMADDLRVIVDAIQKAETFEEVQEQLELVYAEQLDPLALAEKIEKARVVAELNGMHAVVEEL